MAKNNNSSTAFFFQPQIAFFVLALLCLTFGIILTPALLIKLGPMRVSLTSEIDSVQQIAYMEVNLAKIFFLFLAAVLFAVGIFWQRIIHSSFVQSIKRHVPLVDQTGSNKAKLFNFSFYVMLGSTIVGLLYLTFGPQLFNQDVLSAINNEDGLIEYLTVLFIFISMVLSALLAFKFSGNRARVIVHVGIALLFFIMIGEEISWGQRLLNVSTPVALEGNVQGETNLHNMFGYFSDHLFIAGVALYGIGLPILVYFNKFARKLFDLIGIPVASMGLALGFLMASLLQRWVVYRFISPPPNFRIEELREMLVFLGFSLLFWELWRLVRHKNV